MKTYFNFKNENISYLVLAKNKNGMSLSTDSYFHKDNGKLLKKRVKTHTLPSKGTIFAVIGAVENNEQYKDHPFCVEDFVYKTLVENQPNEITYNHIKKSLCEALHNCETPTTLVVGHQEPGHLLAWVLEIQNGEVLQEKYITGTELVRFGYDHELPFNLSLQEFEQMSLKELEKLTNKAVKDCIHATKNADDVVIGGKVLTVSLKPLV